MWRRLALLALAGCASSAEAMTAPAGKPGAAATANNEVGLNPGETMAFEVKLGGVVAGEAQLAVGEIGTFDGHRAVVVKSRAATAGAVALIKKITDEATTVIDLDTGRPLQLDTLVEQGDTTTTATATFHPTSADVVYNHSDEPGKHVFKVEYGTTTVLDTHSAMAQLRGWRATPGATRTVYVVGGRRLWRVDVRYLGSETVSSVLGRRRAIKFEGASYRARANFGLESTRPVRTFTVWLSDDADRVPLKMVAATELGDVTMDLTEYDRH
ncbi:MAG TPA: DUF3108 domain-containing protein [Kofleriaceae bacterium]|nr:DUF3108 domain-containing protein [Kofleriaceae bacterium]